MSVPRRPKLYHVTHGANLRAIIEAGGLLADSEAFQGVSPMKIGNAEVVALRKRRPVPCHPGTCVGDYVPFYFCPRSVMLYVISRHNHQGITYTGSQRAIVHLEADLHTVVQWANGRQVRWAFTLSNAARSDAEFRCRLGDLGEVNWTAVKARQWSGELIERVGVMDNQVAQRVAAITAGSAGSTAVHVEVCRAWYY